ncbi:hypothetical protein [Faecalicatena contorta]|uniref:hypothetical protein n=1 Tax=Faecalicatena contorta TaxID=39482 RepID=UPI001F26B055|nr:hypothetical protein [Faecalicatena contorta]MCF2684043.1 hypothetical protein [Faecalicatena contorta]
MDKMQEITEYINTMKIKKSFFGGFDREDVYVKLGVITGMFQKYIEEFQKSEEKQKEEYEQRVKDSEKNIAQLQQRVGVLLSEKQSVLQEKETALAEKAAAIEENETEKELLKKKSNEQQERLGAQEEELARQKETIEELKEVQQRLEKDKDTLRRTYKEYCSNVLQQYSDSLRTLSAEFSQILENVSNLQKAIVEAESMEIFEVEGQEKTEENMKKLIDEKTE